MKKFLGLILLVAAAISFAASPTAPTLYNNTDAVLVYGQNIYATGNTQGGTSNNGVSTGRDSLVGADTIVLLAKYPVDMRFQYVAQVWDSAGVADTTKYEIQYWTRDGIYKNASALIDSAAGTAPSAGIKRLKSIDLAVNQTSWPGFIRLIAKKPAATAGLITKIYSFSLIQRRPRSAAVLGGGE